MRPFAEEPGRIQSSLGPRFAAHPDHLEAACELCILESQGFPISRLSQPLLVLQIDLTFVTSVCVNRE